MAPRETRGASPITDPDPGVCPALALFRTAHNPTPSETSKRSHP